MRLLVFPAILFVISGAIYWLVGDRLDLPEESGEVVAWLRSQGDWAWAVGVAIILADAILPVPSTPAMFAMGIIYGPILGGIVCGSAAVLSGLLGFGATRMLGRRAVVALVGEADLARTEAFYERWGLYAVVFGRAVGGPAEWAVIFAGLSRMPVGRVLGALCLGGLVSGLVMASLGAMAVEQPALAVGLTILLLAGMLWVGRRATREVPDPPADGMAD